MRAMMFLLRALAVWLVIMCVEFIRFGLNGPFGGCHCATERGIGATTSRTQPPFFFRTASVNAR